MESGLGFFSLIYINVNNCYDNVIFLNNLVQSELISNYIWQYREGGG